MYGSRIEHNPYASRVSSYIPDTIDYIPRRIIYRDYGEYVECNSEKFLIFF